MSYTIAFSIDGATDVTRRYVRNASTHGSPRDKCPEAVLLYIMNEIKAMRRSNIDKDDRKRLIIMDEREEKELRGYVIQNLAAEIGRMIDVPVELRKDGGGAGGGGDGAEGGQRPAVENDKLPQARQTGTQAWIEARGEAGNRQQQAGGRGQQQQPPPPPPPPGRDGI